jgi:hypothetical protein
MQYRKVLDAAQSYSGSNPTNPEFAAAEGNALNSLGDLYLKRGDRIKAAASYDQGAVAVRRQITLEGDKPPVSRVELLASLYRVERNKLGHAEWVEALYRGSENANYCTYYLATNTSHLGILVTMSFHKEYESRYVRELKDTMSTLDIYQK